MRTKEEIIEHIKDRVKAASLIDLQVYGIIVNPKNSILFDKRETIFGENTIQTIRLPN